MSLLPLDTTVPRALPTPAPSPSPSPSRSRFSAAARLTRWTLSLLPLLLIGAWAVLDWRAVRDGAARLASADPWWLLAAALFTCLGWVAAACVRQGAIPDRLPPGLLLASQVAAGQAT
ncbi:UPF0104 family protein, partial [Streptomyces umbrinus]